MIQFRSDCLMLQKSNGEMVPCSIEDVSVELVGIKSEQVDPGMVQQAVGAVLFYFQKDLGRMVVTVAEFTEALEQVLRGLGFDFERIADDSIPLQVARTDLYELTDPERETVELFFFQRLRDELRRQLRNSPQPQVLRLEGLRKCVKRLTGARRWNTRCRQLRDQIVGHVRQCVESEGNETQCAIILR